MRRFFNSVLVWFVITLILLVALIGVHFGAGFSAYKWWSDTFAIATSLLTSAFVALLTYFLVVYLPEERRRSVIKNNLLFMYRNLKEDILVAVVQASIKGGRHDLRNDTETIERLMRPQGFQKAFQNGPRTQANEGFYAFQNQMDNKTTEYREIVLNLRLLSKQIDFLLHNYGLENRKTFDFFKRLERLLIKLQESEAGYEESKPLCGFIRDIYAAYEPITGKADRDIVEKMIDELR